MSNNKTPIRIESICIVHTEDDHSGEDSREDEIGIFVEAVVSYPVNVFRISDQKYQEHRRIETLRSSGMWGIASDISFDEQISVEKEQMADLKSHLEAFGVDVSNFHEIRIEMRCE